MSTLGDAADVNPVIKFLPHTARQSQSCNQVPATHVQRTVWQELDYRIDICRVTEGGHIEHLKGRTETWSIPPSVYMLPFSVTIPATVPQRSEIPEGLMNYPVEAGWVQEPARKLLRREEPIVPLGSRKEKV